MKTIARLKEKTEAISTLSFEQPRTVTQGEDARPDCTCDRWGHLCPGCTRQSAPTGEAKRVFESKETR